MKSFNISLKQQSRYKMAHSRQSLTEFQMESCSIKFQKERCYIEFQMERCSFKFQMEHCSNRALTEQYTLANHAFLTAGTDSPLSINWK